MNNELQVDESELKALSLTQYLPAKGQGHHENFRIAHLWPKI